MAPIYGYVKILSCVNISHSRFGINATYLDSFIYILPVQIMLRISFKSSSTSIIQWLVGDRVFSLN